MLPTGRNILPLHVSTNFSTTHLLISTSLNPYLYPICKDACQLGNLECVSALLHGGAAAQIIDPTTGALSVVHRSPVLFKLVIIIH